MGMVSETLADPRGAYEGRRLFTSYCQLCHGVYGEGDGPLAKKMGIQPVNLKETLRTRSDIMLRKIITGRGRDTITGRDRHDLLSESMPEWEKVFNDAQIEALITYLRFLSTSKHGLMGDPELGMKLYGQYCQVCHGQEGEGDGIMTELMKLEPLDQTNPVVMNDLSNDDLVHSIMEGKLRYMPAWKGILDQNEVEALVSYIRLLSHY
jgi:cbb3-type cytochrome c oxidase subunit III